MSADILTYNESVSTDILSYNDPRSAEMTLDFLLHAFCARLEK